MGGNGAFEQQERRDNEVERRRTIKAIKRDERKLAARGIVMAEIIEAGPVQSGGLDWINYTAMTSAAFFVIGLAIFAIVQSRPFEQQTVATPITKPEQREMPKPEKDSEAAEEEAMQKMRAQNDARIEKMRSKYGGNRRSRLTSQEMRNRSENQAIVLRDMLVKAAANYPEEVKFAWGYDFRSFGSKSYQISGVVTMKTGLGLPVKQRYSIRVDNDDITSFTIGNQRII